MEILGIVGSPRRNGRTNRLVDAALQGAQAHGAAIHKIYLIDYPITPYTGQGGSRDAYTYCPAELSHRCEDADAVILGAPVYWGDINGLTKDFMDTVQIANSSGKPALGIAIAGGSGKGLLSGIQSIYHFFYHKQMRGIDPTPVSRFNLTEALGQLAERGAKLADLTQEATPFAGATWDARWPDVLAYYASIPYLNCDPVDEFILLARQLLRISTGEQAAEAKTLFDDALTCQAEGRREDAARYAVQSYQRLFFPP